MAKISTFLNVTSAKTSISNGRNKVLADQLIADGGSDEGLCPTELLLGALCACASMSIRVYAQRKNIALEHVEISATLSRTDFNETKIVKRLKFTGNLSEEDRIRLLKIADMCFVQKILSNPIEIETIEDI
jgi:putative redox protein